MVEAVERFAEKVWTMKHPLQKLHIDKNGHMRFHGNAIVRYLLDNGPFDLNDLARIPFPREDHEQFAQLIGYSLSGFSELSYVSDRAYAKAEKRADKLRKWRDPRLGEFTDEQWMAALEWCYRTDEGE